MEQFKSLYQRVREDLEAKGMITVLTPKENCDLMEELAGEMYKLDKADKEKHNINYGDN